MNLQQLRDAALAIAHAAIRAVDPEALIHKSVRLEGDRLIIGATNIALSEFRRIIVVGAGKASASMARALETILGNRIAGGSIVVKDGHTRSLQRIEVIEAAHPVPDERGVSAARKLIGLLKENARRDTLVLCLISGGGSALMPLPAEGLSLNDKQAMTRLLLECGASIDEVNIVRKHISGIKGGQLARAAAPARVCTLLLSDAVGDAPDVIASGPTVGDPSTFSDAKAVMEKYNIWHRVPKSVANFIQSGVNGEIKETPKPDDEIFRNVSNDIIGNNRSALIAASEKAVSLGFRPLILSACISGEAREVGTVFASIALETANSHNPIAPPACILAGGETTVTIRGKGKGGRNQELALSAALKLAKSGNIVLASVGTDGTDGPTDAAGAVVDTTTVERARKHGLDPVAYLQRNDSYNLLEPIGDLLKTGPTGTNVMDLLITLVG